MLRFGNLFAGYGQPDEPQPLDRSDYDGQGFWRDCNRCGSVHQIQESAQFRILLEQLCTRVGDSSQALYDEFSINTPDGHWNVDPDKAMFKFTRADGAECFARYGVVSSYNPETHSWLWAWGFPEEWTPAPALRVANHCHQRCADEGWTPGTERTLLVNPHDAWHLTKLAAHIVGYPMVYRASVNNTNHHYFAIDRPIWAI